MPASVVHCQAPCTQHRVCRDATDRSRLLEACAAGVDVGLVSGLTRDLILLNILALVEMMIWVLMMVDAQVRMLTLHVLGVP